MKKSSVENTTPDLSAIFLAKVDFPDPGKPLIRTNFLSDFCYGSIVKFFYKMELMINQYS